MRLSPDQLAWVRQAYNYLVDLGEDDPPEIDPVTWQQPDGDRVIHIAAGHGNIAVVEMLLDAGEDPNVIGDLGNTPAHFAAMFQRRAVFDVLLERGADVTIVNESGYTPPQTWALFEKLESSG